MKMIVVVNEQGHVVAAAHAALEPVPDGSHSDAPHKRPTCGLGTLPGQRMKIVDLPEHLHAIDVEQRLRAMLDHRMRPDSTSLEYVPRSKN
ncbi:MAG: hypothetical protein H7274_16300 [Rhodoferax sp.]|nr:hypothetical protein [Rhodoferax sp.]